MTGNAMQYGRGFLLRMLFGAALAACRSGESGTGPTTADSSAAVLPPPAARETVTVPAWVRTGVTFPYTLDPMPVRAASSFLTVSPGSLSAIDPLTGAALWNIPVAPLSGYTGSGLRYQVMVGDSDRGDEWLLDATDGRQQYVASLGSGGARGMLGATPTLLLRNVGVTALELRNAANGAVLWRKPVTLGDCGFIDDGLCFRYVGHAGGAFLLVRTASVSSGSHELIRFSDTGDLKVTKFVEPASFPGPVLTLPPTYAAVDAAGTVVVIGTYTGHVAVDATTGAVRWAAPRLAVSNGVLMEQPVALLTQGADPLLHLVFRYSTLTSGGYSREIVRNAVTGRIVRQVLRSATDLDGLGVQPCGETGMVLMRTRGRYIHTDTRTGTETAGQLVDAATRAPVDFPVRDSTRWTASFPQGALVFATGRTPDGLFGFRCTP